MTDGALVQIYLQPVVAAGQSPAPQFLAGEALANPLTGAYSVTVGQFVNPLPAGEVDATATATVTGGVVTGFTVTGGGSGYASGTVTAITVTNGGSGYTTAPTVMITGGGGSGATGAAVVNSSGVITGVSLTGVLSIALSNGGGSGYSSTSPPTVTITGGGGLGATATAVVTGGAVTGFIVNNPGSGYTSLPTVTVDGPGGSGTTATGRGDAHLGWLGLHLGPDGHDHGRRRHRRGGDGEIGGLPTVTLIGGGSATGFVPATATAIVTGGVVTGITIVTAGSGYATAQTVLIASPNLPSLPDGSYSATAIQYDVAGNASQAVQFGNTGAVVIDGTDSPNHGDANGPGGTNENAWFYMQQVLNVIEPNITATPKTLVVLGATTRRSPAVVVAAAAVADRGLSPRQSCPRLPRATCPRMAGISSTSTERRPCRRTSAGGPRQTVSASNQPLGRSRWVRPGSSTFPQPTISRTT